MKKKPALASLLAQAKAGGPTRRPLALLQSVASKVHTIHPAALLGGIAIAAWLAPAIAFGIADRLSALGSKEGALKVPGAGAVPNSIGGPPPLGTTPPMIIQPYAGGFADGFAGQALGGAGNSLGGSAYGSDGGGSPNRKPQSSQPAVPKSSGAVASRGDPNKTGGSAPTGSLAGNSSHLNQPPHQPAGIPPRSPAGPLATPAPGAPQQLGPNPPRIASAAPVAPPAQQPARPNIFVVPPSVVQVHPFGFLARPFAFGRPMVARPYSGGTSAGRGHR
jgi:hypothetical protein